MKIYFAGLNYQHDINKFLYTDYENIFSGGEARHWIIESSPVKENADIFGRGSPLARGGLYDQAIYEHRPYVLESFFYADEDTERLLKFYGDFLLDSGAFTFMQNAKEVNWNDYIERYADFVKRNKIEKFFELDVDSVTGYEKVKEFRKEIERQTGRQCIPVWHKSRGIEEFKRLADEYSYIALGGIAIKEIKQDEYKYFPALIQEAHKRGAKIHGLGFTSLTGIEKYHFDTVDSTAWTTGNRFGYLYYFDGKTMKKKDAPAGHRIIKPREAALNNYLEWLKFQKWADTHL